MYNVTQQVPEPGMDKIQSHGPNVISQESKLSQVKALAFELREANISLKGRVRDIKLFLCGDGPEVDQSKKEEADPNGEFEILINVLSDALISVNKAHGYMSELEQGIKP